jgi:beta-N-acetylhexosaminidase
VGVGWSETPFPALEELIGRMSLADKIGQMVMAVNVANAPETSDVRRLIVEGRVGSLIATGHRHLDAPAIARRNSELQRLALEHGAGVPLLMGGDFEQGLASIMPRASTAFPQQMGFGAAGDLSLAEAAAFAIGVEARALGFHWTFAPNADVQVNPANPVIGVRSFGDQTEQVAAFVTAQVRGYLNARLLATPKHFPGHGDADVDSHRGLPVITESLAELERIHLPPFRDAFAAGVGSAMTAHIVVPALDPELPATLSRPILTGLLREKLGFEGIVITDMMNMKAIADNWPVEESAVLAVRAGADIVMPGPTTEEQIRTVQGLLAAAEAGVIPRARIDASVRRVLRAKAWAGVLEGPFVDDASAATARSGEHEETARRLFRRSIVLVRNDGSLPFVPDPALRTLVVGVSTVNVFGGPTVSHVGVAAEAARRVAGGPVESWSASGEDPTDAEIAEALALAGAADRVIALTYSRGTLPAGQSRLIAALLETGKPVAAVATSTPYDIREYPNVGAYVASFVHSFAPTHLATPAGLACAMEVLFGAEPEGRLPVTIPGLYEAGHGLRHGVG